MTVTIHTAKPGIVIGRGGAKVEELRNALEHLTGGRVRVNIQEIRTPELDAYLVARSVADQLERRVAFRRAIKQSVQRTMQRGALGVRVAIAGRLGGAEMSRREVDTAGPRAAPHAPRGHRLRPRRSAHHLRRIGVKVWIFKGEILPELRPEPKVIEEEPEPIAGARAASPRPSPAARPTRPSAMEQQEAVQREQGGDS